MELVLPLYICTPLLFPEKFEKKGMHYTQKNTVFSLF